MITGWFATRSAGLYRALDDRPYSCVWGKMVKVLIKCLSKIAFLCREQNILFVLRIGYRVVSEDTKAWKGGISEYQPEWVMASLNGCATRKCPQRSIRHFPIQTAQQNTNISIIRKVSVKSLRCRTNQRVVSFWNLLRSRTNRCSYPLDNPLGGNYVNEITPFVQPRSFLTMIFWVLLFIRMVLSVNTSSAISHDLDIILLVIMFSADLALNLFFDSCHLKKIASNIVCFSRF